MFTTKEAILHLVTPLMEIQVQLLFAHRELKKVWLDLSGSLQTFSKRSKHAPCTHCSDRRCGSNAGSMVSSTLQDVEADTVSNWRRTAVKNGYFEASRSILEHPQLDTGSLRIELMHDGVAE